jgi:sporulation-control protein spo0M
MMIFKIRYYHFYLTSKEKYVEAEESAYLPSSSIKAIVIRDHGDYAQIVTDCHLKLPAYIVKKECALEIAEKLQAMGV